MLLETLSQLVRKPSKATDSDLRVTGWKEKQTRVLKHMERDQVLINLLEDFRSANDRLKFIRSKRDAGIYFINEDRGSDIYTYARCMFTVDGKPKEFREYLGRASDVNLNKINLEDLRKTFLKKLKKFLEHQN